MGYAILTMRKLSLRSRINQCNANLMIFSQRHLDYATRKGEIQVEKATMTANAALGRANAQRDWFSSHSISNYTASDENGSSYEQYQAAYQAAASNWTVDEAQAKVDEADFENQIQEISALENALELQKKALETEVQAYQAEYETVEKSESHEIKAATPRYGGSQ